jgi:hypothetical protein
MPAHLPVSPKEAEAFVKILSSVIAGAGEGEWFRVGRACGMDRGRVVYVCAKMMGAALMLREVSPMTAGEVAERFGTADAVPTPGELEVARAFLGRLAPFTDWSLEALLRSRPGGA